jgi:cobalt-zinc-cadmium efflux system membrane fusion protein
VVIQSEDRLAQAHAADGNELPRHDFTGRHANPSEEANMNRHRFNYFKPQWLAVCGGVAALGVGLSVAPLAAPDHGHDHDIKQPAKKAAAEPGADEHEGHADEVKLTPEAIHKHRIRVEPVRRQNLRPSFVVPARVSFNAEAMAHVGSAVKGRITDLKVKVGDEVKKDDVLVAVESPDLGEAQLDFLQKRAAAAAAGPLLDAAKSSYERANTLYESAQGITLTELQKREIDLKTAQATLRTSGTAATAAENRLHLLGMSQPEVEHLASTEQINPRFAIRAPISGQVTEREVTLGELVGPEREHILVIADMSRLWVLADVPEARLKGLRHKAEARLTLAAMPEEKVTGVVSFVAQTVDPATRTAKVRIEVENRDGELRPGMFGSVEIIGGGNGTGQAVLALPDDAVQTVDGGPAVFVPVEGEENTFARRAVTVGNPVGDWVPVLSGLKEGEPVVAGGSFVLKADLGKSGAAHEH